MKRRSLLIGAGACFTAALPLSAAAGTMPTPKFPPDMGKPVKPPANGDLRVGFVVGPETVAIDVVGPWEAFIDVMLPIHLYSVAPTMDYADLGGIKMKPDYTFADAPMPHVLVVPATKALPETLAWIKKASSHADVMMSVCVGAFLLAKAGLLDGLYATTHHTAYDDLAHDFPKVKVIRGERYVENADISCSAGESSGIELALRVIERYYGKKAAATSAEGMEYVRGAPAWT